MQPWKGNWLVLGGAWKREIKVVISICHYLSETSWSVVLKVNGWGNEPTSYIHKQSPSHNWLFFIPLCPLLSQSLSCLDVLISRAAGEFGRTFLCLCRCVVCCLAWLFILRCHLLSKSRNILTDHLMSHSSSARWTPAEFSSTPTDDRTGNAAPQCPLFVGVCQWRWQTKDQEAALGPGGGPLDGPDDHAPTTLLPQTQWADAA